MGFFKNTMTPGASNILNDKEIQMERVKQILQSKNSVETVEQMLQYSKNCYLEHEWSNYFQQTYLEHKQPEEPKWRYELHYSTKLVYHKLLADVLEYMVGHDDYAVTDLMIDNNGIATNLAFHPDSYWDCVNKQIGFDKKDYGSFYSNSEDLLTHMYDAMCHLRSIPSMYVRDYGVVHIWSKCVDLRKSSSSRW